MKPGAFFVVSGEEGGRKFYTRYDSSAAATPPIRGFTFAYPARRATISTGSRSAVANSFQPFPQPGPAAGATGGHPPSRRSAAPRRPRRPRPR